MAFAIWSYPNETDFKVTRAPLRKYTLFEPKKLQHSFVVMPFDASNGLYAIPIDRSVHVTQARDFLSSELPKLFPTKVMPTLPSYEGQVAAAVAKIQRIPAFNKVVLSRYAQVDGVNFNEGWLDQLRTAYPTAFIAMVSSAKFGTWLTASPELFLKRDESVFSSFSLAGTKFSANTVLGIKEQQEQSIVTDYIRDAFERSGLRSHVDGNREQEAGTLVHLLNVVEGQIRMDAPQVHQLVANLHPTPAVGGEPLSIARASIDQEGYDRGLYTGFMGEVEGSEHFELYVNLRCAQVFSNAIRFYAGAGITGDSIPHKEFLETEAKMNVLKSVLLSQQ